MSMSVRGFDFDLRFSESASVNCLRSTPPDSEFEFWPFGRSRLATNLGFQFVPDICCFVNGETNGQQEVVNGVWCKVYGHPKSRIFLTPAEYCMTSQNHYFADYSSIQKKSSL